MFTSTLGRGRFFAYSVALLIAKAIAAILYIMGTLGMPKHFEINRLLSVPRLRMPHSSETKRGAARLYSIALADDEVAAAKIRAELAAPPLSTRWTFSAALIALAIVIGLGSAGVIYYTTGMHSAPKQVVVNGEGKIPSESGPGTPLEMGQEATNMGEGMAAFSSVAPDSPPVSDSLNNRQNSLSPMGEVLERLFGGTSGNIQLPDNWKTLLFSDNFTEGADAIAVGDGKFLVRKIIQDPIAAGSACRLIEVHLAGQLLTRKILGCRALADTWEAATITIEPP